MALRDPIAAYNGENNLEAHLVCDLLIEAGIEASVVEDISQVGAWIGGLVPEIHKPQVWIDRSDIERARPVLAAYQQKVSARLDAAAGGELIEARCEECGMSAHFPASQKGSVQTCPHCQAYVDVGDEAEFAGWDDLEGEQAT